MDSIVTPADADRVRAECLARMEALDRQYPGEPAFESIITQLRWLAGPLGAGGRVPDKDKLTFGFLGVKFVREFDDDLSKSLSSLSQFIERYL